MNDIFDFFLHRMRDGIPLRQSSINWSQSVRIWSYLVKICSWFSQNLVIYWSVIRKWTTASVRTWVDGKAIVTLALRRYGCLKGPWMAWTEVIILGPNQRSAILPSLGRHVSNGGVDVYMCGREQNITVVSSAQRCFHCNKQCIYSKPRITQAGIIKMYELSKCTSYT